MNIDLNTKLTDLLKAYPFLKDEAVKIDKRLNIINSPIGKMMIKNMTIADAEKKANVPANEIIAKIKEVIQKHNQNS